MVSSFFRMGISHGRIADTHQVFAEIRHKQRFQFAFARSSRSMLLLSLERNSRIRGGIKQRLAGAGLSQPLRALDQQGRGYWYLVTRDPIELFSACTPEPIELYLAAPEPIELLVVTPEPIELYLATPEPIELLVVTPEPIELYLATPEPIELLVVTPEPIELYLGSRRNRLNCWW